MYEGMNDKMDFNTLKENYDKFTKCARGFPSYLKYVLSEESNNKVLKKKAKNYFEMMLSLYLVIT